MAASAISDETFAAPEQATHVTRTRLSPAGHEASTKPPSGRARRGSALTPKKHCRRGAGRSGKRFLGSSRRAHRLHATQESFSSAAMLAEVPLAGLILSLILRGPSRLWPPALPLGRGPLGRLGGKLGREGPQPGHHRCEPLGLLLN